MARSEARIFEFDEFELDERRGELRLAGEIVELLPKPLELLSYLLRHRDRVVPKDEVLDVVWAGVAVSDAALASALKQVRRALRDDGSQQRFVRTMRGRGYRFIAPVADRSARPVVAETRPDGSVFVGRRRVLEQLEHALDATCRGEGRCVLLAGEAGIGKTRTFEQLAESARQRGVPVHTGHCYEGDGVPALWPFEQVLSKLTEGLDDGSLHELLSARASEIAQIVPGLRERLSLRPPAAVEPPEAGRFRLYEGVVDFLKRSAGAKEGMVVFLDDLHWADASSLRLLDLLVRELPGAPLLVAGAYRTGAVDGDHPMTAILEAFARHDWCDVTRLGGLDRDEIRELLGVLTGRPVGREWAARVAARTDGNPFFVRQLLPLLEGYDLARPPAEDDPPLAIPGGVRDSVRARLARLPASCRDVLEACAVLGREFEPDVLARTLGHDVDSLDADLAAAREAGLLREAGRGPCGFVHALVQEAVLEEVAEARRRDLHARAAVALEAGSKAASGPRLAALAHHLTRGASRSDSAVDHLMRAGRDSAARFAWEEADGRFARALELLDPRAQGDRAARCDLLCDRGLARHRLGKADTRSLFLEAAEIARELGDGARFARAVDGFLRGREASLEDPYEQETTLLHEALERLGDEEPARRVVLQAQLAGRYRTVGDIERAHEILDEAGRGADALGDGLARAEVALARAYVAWGEEPPERLLEIADRLVALGDAAGALDAASHGVRLRMCAHVVLADLEAADREYAELDRRTHEHGLEGWIPTLYAHRVMRALVRGELEEAERLSLEQLQVGVGYEERAALSSHIGQISLIKEARGELASLEPALRTYAERKADPIVHASVAAVYARLGREEETRRHYLHALRGRGPEAIARNEWWAGSLGLLAECCAFLRDRERAPGFRRLLEPLRERVIVTGLAIYWYPPGSMLLGLLDLADADFDAAVGSFERAARTCERMGAPLWVARARFHQAHALAARGRDGDRELALGRLADVMETAVRLDLPELQHSAGEAVAGL